jgi:hypothetical protein
VNTASKLEYGYRSGETLSERLVRLDVELVKLRGPVGARGEPVVDLDGESWPDQALDSLCRIQALITSSVARIPYAAARDAMALCEEERARLKAATENVIKRHASFFEEHRDAILVVVGLTAIQGAWLDQLMLATTEDRTFTPWETIGALLILFSPLLLFLVLYGLGQQQRQGR